MIKLLFLKMRSKF